MSLSENVLLTIWDTIWNLIQYCVTERLNLVDTFLGTKVVTTPDEGLIYFFDAQQIKNTVTYIHRKELRKR